jgi:hypothetical protein
MSDNTLRAIVCICAVVLALGVFATGLIAALAGVR